MISNKTCNMGFITRTCFNFNNLNVFKNVYIAFVRSPLKYTTLIWSSNNLCITQNIEALSNHFLRFIFFRFKVERPQHSGYSGVLSYFNLKSLNERRSYLNCIFLLKLLNNLFDCPCLLERLDFQINFKSTRNQTICLIK